MLQQILTLRVSFLYKPGALDQSVDHSPILLSETTFPAVRATLQNNYVGTTAEAAIATSSSLSTQTRSFEKTPTFQSAGIFGATMTAIF